jgi:Na+:H+ antiporter, NhaA family
LSRRRPDWRDSEAAPGLVLMACAAAAMVIANTALGHGYHRLFETPLGWTPVARLPDLHAWINDGLMAVFFFVVGLEIKREALAGALSHPRSRRVPIAAAAAGMAVPALVYLAVVGGDPALARGWAIPAATDIAFAMGVLALVGPRAPPVLRLFLLTVAVADDIGAVAIIAVFYTAALDLAWLAAAAALLAALIGLNRAGVKRLEPYLVLTVGLWLAVLHSGVHATVAGVLAALTIPLRNDRHGNSPLLRLEHRLVPWNGFVIVPLFGFANAGVAVAGLSGSSAVSWAIAAGLALGKPAGVLASLFVAQRLTGGRMAGTSWAHLWGVALLCGVGFTMSLFIAGLAFPGQPELIDEAKLGIVAGSLVSATVGYLTLRFAAPPPAEPGD